VAIAAAFAATPACGQEAPPELETRAAMGAIVQQLAFLLPLSLDDERFGDPAQHDAILGALRELARLGETLEAHGRDRDAGFDFLSRSLARDTSEMLLRYEQGRVAESRFLTHQLTDNCIACHSRLPDPQPHPLGQLLFASTAISELPLDERVRLQIATRQFDAALASFEALFTSPDQSASDLDLTGQLDAYLELCLRVAGDPERPIPVLEGLAKREDTRAPLRENLRAWTASLRELRERTPAETPLAEAHALLEVAKDRSRFPDDRRALVYYIAASSVLHRYVAGAPPSRRDRGEAYYLLGLIESHVGRSFWLSQTEHYLETAIRVAPEQRYASEAYALLEEFVVSGYTGSAGGAVPEDVRERLAELRALIEPPPGS
jgi:hypothetical protein